jgi:hypothetical protein
MLESFQQDLPYLERMNAAQEAMRKGRASVARDLLATIVTSNANDRIRHEAERWLESLSRR